MQMMDTETATRERLQADLQAAVHAGDAELAYSLLEELLELASHIEVEPAPTPAPIRWNEDPKWVAYTFTYETEIRKIANKYTTDEALREDCEQEARIALLTIFPERLKDFDLYTSGQLGESQWKTKLSAYCRNVIRNSILSYLESMNTGNWYIGRTTRVRDRQTGERVKTHSGPRYSSMDELVEEAGLQVDTEGNLTWDRVSTDGLDASRNDPAVARPIHPNNRPLDGWKRP